MVGQEEQGDGLDYTELSTYTQCGPLFPRSTNPRPSNYTQDDSDVIYSYHIYASCFPAMMCDKLCEIFVIVTSIS